MQGNPTIPASDDPIPQLVTDSLKSGRVPCAVAVYHTDHSLFKWYRVGSKTEFPRMTFLEILVFEPKNKNIPKFLRSQYPIFRGA